MLPPDSTTATRRPATSGDVAAEQRGDADRARALDHELLALQEQRDGLDDLLVGDRHHLVHVPLDEREGQLAGALDRDAVGDRLRARDRPRSARADAIARTPRSRSPARRRRARRAAARVSASAMPASRPPPPHGTTTTSTSGTCSASSSPTVPWPGDDAARRRTPRRRSRRCSPPARARPRCASSKVEPLSSIARAVAARRLHLGHRRVDRHEDRRLARRACARRARRPARGCRRSPPPRRGRARRR